jgi:hypothetical protein
MPVAPPDWRRISKYLFYSNQLCTLLKHSNIFKKFVKHIIKTLNVSITIVWTSSCVHLSCLKLLLFLFLFASSSCLFGMWLYVVYVCACLNYLCVEYLVVNTTKHPTHKYIRHAHTLTTYSHIPNKQLDVNKQRSSKSTKHERRSPEDGQTIVTETCRVLKMCFSNIFNNLVF